MRSLSFKMRDNDPNNDEFDISKKSLVYISYRKSKYRMT